MVKLLLNDTNESFFDFTDTGSLESTETDFRTSMYTSVFREAVFSDYDGASYEKGSDLIMSAIFNSIRFEEKWLKGLSGGSDVNLKPALRFKTMGFEFKSGAYYYSAQLRVSGVHTSSNKYYYTYDMYLRKELTSIKSVGSSNYIPVNTGDYLTNPLYSTWYSFRTTQTENPTPDLPFKFGIRIRPDNVIEPYGIYRNSVVDWTFKTSVKFDWTVSNSPIVLTGIFSRSISDNGTFTEFFYPSTLSSSNKVLLTEFEINAVTDSNVVNLIDKIVFNTNSIQTVGLQSTTEISIVDVGLKELSTHISNIGKIHRTFIGDNILVEGEIREIEPLDDNSVKYSIIGGSSKLDSLLVNQSPITYDGLIEGIYQEDNKTYIRSFTNQFTEDDINRVLVIEKDNKKMTSVQPLSDYSIRKEIYKDELYSESTEATGDDAPDLVIGEVENLFEDDWKNYPPAENMLGLANYDLTLTNRENYGFILDYPISYNQDNTILSIDLNLISSHFDFAFYDDSLQIIGHPEILILYKKPITVDGVLTHEDRWFKLHQIESSDTLAISNTNVKKPIQRYNEAEFDPWGDVFDYSSDTVTPIESKESLNTSINLNITELIKELNESKDNRKGITLSSILYDYEGYDNDSSLENQSYIRICIRSGNTNTRQKLMLWSSTVDISFEDDQDGDHNTAQIITASSNLIMINDIEGTGLIQNGYGINDRLVIVKKVNDYLAGLNNSRYPIELKDNLDDNYAIGEDFTDQSYNSLLSQITNDNNYIWYLNYNDQKIYLKKPRKVAEYDLTVISDHAYQKPALITYDGSEMKTNIRIIGDDLKYELSVTNQPVLNLEKDYYTENLQTASERIVKEKAVNQRLIGQKPREYFEINVQKTSPLNQLKIGDFINVNYIYKSITYNPSIPLLVYSISLEKSSDIEAYTIILQRRESI